MIKLGLAMIELVVGLVLGIFKSVLRSPVLMLVISFVAITMLYFEITYKPIEERVLNKCFASASYYMSWADNLEIIDSNVKFRFDVWYNSTADVEFFAKIDDTVYGFRVKCSYMSSEKMQKKYEDEHDEWMNELYSEYLGLKVLYVNDRIIVN